MADKDKVSSVRRIFSRAKSQEKAVLCNETDKDSRCAFMSKILNRIKGDKNKKKKVITSIKVGKKDVPHKLPASSHT